MNDYACDNVECILIIIHTVFHSYLYAFVVVKEEAKHHKCGKTHTAQNHDPISNKWVNIAL